MRTAAPWYLASTAISEPRPLLLTLHLPTRQQLHSCSSKPSAKSLAEPVPSHVSIVEHSVPVMMICGARTAKNLDVSSRPKFLIWTGKCSGRTGWRLKARFCTMCSFTPASNNVGQAWQSRYFRMLALLKMAVPFSWMRWPMHRLVAWTLSWFGMAAPAMDGLVAWTLSWSRHFCTCQYLPVDGLAAWTWHDADLSYREAGQTKAMEPKPSILQQNLT